MVTFSTNTHKYKRKCHRIVKQMPKQWMQIQAVAAAAATTVIVDKMNLHQIKIQNPNKQKVHASEKGKHFLFIVYSARSVLYANFQLTSLVLLQS